jgi:hypothetical protein
VEDGLSRSYRWVRVIVTLGTLLVSVLGTGCQRASEFDDRLKAIVKPYEFSILRWELSQILGRPETVTQQGEPGSAKGNDSELASEYFSLVHQTRAVQQEINAIASGNREGDVAARLAELETLQTRKAALRDTVRRTIGRQIRETLNKQGIFNPADRHIKVKLTFPPINFRLDQPPNVLIISARDRIGSMREVMLVQGLDLDQFEDIEADVDAGMVSGEIAALVLATYYPQYETPRTEGGPPPAGFDFNREMRELRLAVDELLANGEIERAEELMEERRQYLASKGYYIRKINQAYFAFYGTYADEPTSVSPIGIEMGELRKQSTSLREFLNTSAAMTSREDLIDSLKAPPDDKELFVRLLHQRIDLLCPAGGDVNQPPKTAGVE